GSTVGIVRQRSPIAVPKRPRHPEVNQQRPTRLKPNNQILAAPLERPNALALKLGGDLARVEGTRQPRVEDRHGVESAPLEERRQSPANGLDLGQLGHGSRLAGGRSLDAPSDRRAQPTSSADELSRRRRAARAARAERRPRARRPPAARPPRPPPTRRRAPAPGPAVAPARRRRRASPGKARR